jgi:heptosyltransferase III
MDRFLVMRGGALGDFILGLPALRRIHDACPWAAVELIAPANFLPLAHGVVDSTTPLEKSFVASLFQEYGHFPEEISQRYRDLDAVVIWFADSAGTVRQNFRRLGAKKIVWAPSKPQSPDVHAADHLMASLRGLGIAAPPTDRAVRSSSQSWPHIQLSLPAHEKAGEVWRAMGLETSIPVVAMHPGSGASWKRWGSDKFARLSDLLVTEGVQVVLIEGPADYHAVRQVRSKMEKDPPRLLAGVDVESLGAFLSRCVAYVGNDSGVTHLAAGVGTPTVAIFGPTNPNNWAPRGPRVSVVHVKKPCMPCWQGDPPACEHRLCLESVGADQVMTMLRPLLDRARAALPPPSESADPRTELAVAKFNLPGSTPEDDE